MSARKQPAAWCSFFLALGVRSYFLLRWQRSPFADIPIVDGQEYHRWALEILRGRFLSVPLIHGPTYPVFAALLYRLVVPWPWVVYFAQALLGAWAAFLCSRIALEETGEEAASWAAGAAAALAWPLVYGCGELMPQVLEAFLVILALRLFSRPGSEGSSRAAAGGLMAAACLSRPQLLVPAAALLLLPSPGGGRRPPRAAYGLPLLLLPMLWGSAVWLRTGTPVLLSTRGGFNLYLGNHPGATGEALHFPGHESSRLLREAEDQAETGGKDAVFLRLLREDLRRRPLAVARLWLRKLGLAAADHEIPAGTALPWQADGSFPVLRLFGFGLLLAVGLPGLVSFWKDGGAPRAYPVFFAAGLLSVVAAAVAGRYRAPLVPVLAVGAGRSASLAARWLRAGDRRRLALLASAAALLYGASLAAGRLADRRPRRELALASSIAALTEGGRTGAARSLLEARLAEEPRDRDARLYEALLLLQDKDLAAAEESFLRLSSEAGGELPLLHSYVGVLRSSRGDRAGARAAALEAYRADPRSLEDCLGAVFYGLSASPPLAGPRDAYACPLEPGAHHPSSPEVESLSRELSLRRVPDGGMREALLPVETWLMASLARAREGRLSR